MAAAPAHAAFHLWEIREIYTDASGSLQFIELFTASASQQFIAGHSITVTATGGSPSNTFNISTNSPSPTAGHALLFGTAGLQAAGGPVPDYIIPDGFLFAGGGSISFFGTNSGTYTALPTDGVNSRTWGAGNATNSPQNYAGTIGFVSVAGPTATPTEIATATPVATPTPTVTSICPTNPSASCLTAGKSGLSLKLTADPAKLSFKWKWNKGLAAAAQADFGDPVSGSPAYTLCLYDQTASVSMLKMALSLEAGGLCGDDDPCWTAKSDKGWTYKNKAGNGDGLTKLNFKGGDAGKPALQVAGKGVNLPLPSPLSASEFFDQDTAVIVQFHTSSPSACWSSTFTTSKKNEAVQFKATAVAP